MIALIIGPDTARPSARAQILKGASAREILFGDAMKAESLLSLSQSQSLFGESRVYGIVGAAEDEGWFKSISKILPTLQESVHLFIFEEDAGAPFAKAVEKIGGIVSKVKTQKKEESLDTFALAAALGSRDRKKLWLLYMQALASGASAEMLAGMLAWKARSMLGAEKNGRVPGGWKEGESEKLSRTIVSLYHDSRRGAGSLELLLEKFILQL